MKTYRCPSGKDRFHTKESADSSAAHCMKKRNELIRVYQCPTCHGFHMTRRDAFSAWANDSRSTLAGTSPSP